MPLTDRVKQILSWYGSDNPGTRANLVRMMNTGTLAGTGKMVILPVDQGFEHGPARSFQPNPDGYDPDYHAQLAVDSGCNAYAAPLGFLEAVADRYAGQIPLILKLNNSDTLAKVDAPCSALTGTVKDALRLGCTAIGYTIYPGSPAIAQKLARRSDRLVFCEKHPEAFADGAPAFTKPAQAVSVCLVGELPPPMA